MAIKPLLTICIFTYNNEKTIEKTLKSVLNQTYSNFEVLISDNNSSDRTLEIVDSFKNSKIFVRKNNEKIKSDKWYVDGYDNYNGCIKSGMIRGEFVSLYHSDDIYEKDITKKEIEFLINNPKVGAVFTLGKIINKKDEIIGKHKIPKELKSKNIYNFEEIFKSLLKYGNIFLITPTFMTRKSVFEKLGLFTREEFETSADLDMWLRILKNYNIGILRENLINRRIGGASKSYNSLRTKEADYFTVMDYYLKKEIPFLKIENKLLRQHEYQRDSDNTLRAMNFLIKNDIKEAKKIINKPFSWDLFRAFFGNINILRLKILVLKIILFIGINLRFGKYLGKALYKLQR